MRETVKKGVESLMLQHVIAGSSAAVYPSAAPDRPVI